MKLTIDEVRHVSELAKLDLNDAELNEFSEQLSQILEYAERIRSVDTSSIAPTPYVLPVTNVLAEDVPVPSLTNEEAIANAPDTDDGYFRVTAVFEE